MQNPRRTRKHFRQALTEAGTTAKAFAAAAGVSEGHLHAFLRGERTSAPLEAKITGFIALYTPAAPTPSTPASAAK